jgi:agmatine deiminase
MFTYPAEWESHQACWLAWPTDQNLWGDDLAEAQTEFVGLCQNIQGEDLYVLVCDDKAEHQARGALAGLAVKFIRMPYGDIWLRDTAPIFLKSNEGKIAASCFRFNGWGEKYILDHDDAVAKNISSTFGGKIETFFQPWILEGGSVEVDGFGTCLTTEQCLLNANRNPDLSREQIELRLKENLGVRKTLWLKDGLINDHTDGHIDTIARFAPNGVVLYMKPADDRDPNFKILEQIRNDLSGMTNAKGEKLQLVEVPSPGEVRNDDDKKLMPASYLNFYIANESVVVPTYGVSADNTAVAAIAKCFPGRKTVGAKAKAILKGGGAFHCITQQLPKA